MALIITTNNPCDIIRRFRELVNNNQIQTWQVDSDGDYTIALDQWRNKAWMRPSVNDNGQLIYHFVSSTKHPITRALYGIFHGRLAATLLAHFDTDMDKLEITPLLAHGIDIY